MRQSVLRVFVLDTRPTRSRVNEYRFTGPQASCDFDRLLVAQAKVEGLTLVTRDVHLENYGVPIIAV